MYIYVIRSWYHKPRKCVDHNVKTMEIHILLCYWWQADDGLSMILRFGYLRKIVLNGAHWLNCNSMKCANLKEINHTWARLYIILAFTVCHKGCTLCFLYCNRQVYFRFRILQHSHPTTGNCCAKLNRSYEDIEYNKNCNNTHTHPEIRFLNPLSVH